MKIIVSTTIPDKFREFTVCKNISKIKEFESNLLDYIILHSYPETEFEAAMLISQYKQKGFTGKIIYISEEPNMMVSMLCYKTFTDTFYFDDEEELNGLIEELEAEEEDNNIYALTTKPALDVLYDFLDRFSKGDRIIQTPLFLERVNSAVVELQNLTTTQATELQDYTLTVENVFVQASQVMINLERNRKELKKKLDDIENEINKSSNANNGSFFGSEISYFNPYKQLSGIHPTLLIREMGTCKYLLSFLLSFVHYLHYSKNYRVKFVICDTKSYVNAQKFSNIDLSDFSMIMSDNFNIKSLYDANTCFTNYPTKEVMRDLISTNSYDYVIVLDRMKGRLPIVEGKVKYLFAINSTHELETFNLPKDKTFTSCIQDEEFFYSIPTIKDFNTLQDDAKIAAYSQICSMIFEKMLTYMGRN